jgi:hypothetical protein
MCGLTVAVKYIEIHCVRGWIQMAVLARRPEWHENTRTSRGALARWPSCAVEGNAIRHKAAMRIDAVDTGFQSSVGAKWCWRWRLQLPTAMHNSARLQQLFLVQGLNRVSPAEQASEQQGARHIPKHVFLEKGPSLAS